MFGLLDSVNVVHPGRCAVSKSFDSDWSSFVFEFVNGQSGAHVAKRDGFICPNS
jgi:hypothetical protein